MKSIIYLILFLSCFVALCQQTFNAAVIPSKDGAVITYTSSEKAFTIAIESDSIQPTETPNFLTVDGWILQTFILGFDNPKALDMSIEENAKSALSQYTLYELDYIKEQLKLQVEPQLEWGEMNGRYFYFWYFDTPPELESLQGQLYLTTICFDHFLNLNIPLEKGKEYDKAKTFLLNLGNQIMLHDHPIDFEEFYNELNK